MERLTEKNKADTGYFYPNCFEKCSGMGCTSKCDACELQMQICEKLGRYEDIGLTPEQIMGIDRMYRELAEKLAERSETNADRIRSMTDDELAEMLSTVSQHCVVYLSDKINCRHSSCDTGCKNNIKKWLREESEE